jgi:hypothetical protein
MNRALLLFAGAFALPALLAAQAPEIPNEHAADTAKSKVSLHSQGAQHRATQVRGELVGLEHRPTWIAVPPVGRAAPHEGGATTPAAPPTGDPPHPAVPAQPPGKPLSPGQSGSHRP